MKVKLSSHFGIKCCINCAKNISDKIIVGSGFRVLTGTGSTIERNCLYTKRYTKCFKKMGNRVGRSKNWEWGKNIRNG